MTDKIQDNFFIYFVIKITRALMVIFRKRVKWFIITWKLLLNLV